MFKFKFGREREQESTVYLEHASSYHLFPCLSQEHHPWLRSSVVSIANPENMTTRLTIENVHLGNSTWTAYGLALFINKSDLGKTRMILESTHSGSQAIFLNTTVGRLQTSSNCQVTFKDCVVEGKDRLDVTMIEATESDIFFTRSRFTNNRAAEGPSLLKSFASIVTAEHSHFTNNSGPDGVFQILDGRSLNVTDCKFANNAALHRGSAITASRSLVTLRESHLTGNTAVFGGAFLADNFSTVSVHDSYFTRNSATGSGGAVYLSRHTIGSITDCVFAHNKAEAADLSDSLQNHIQKVVH